MATTFALSAAEPRRRVQHFYVAPLEALRTADGRRAGGPVSARYVEAGAPCAACGRPAACASHLRTPKR